MVNVDKTQSFTDSNLDTLAAWCYCSTINERNQSHFSKIRKLKKIEKKFPFLSHVITSKMLSIKNKIWRKTK